MNWDQIENNWAAMTRRVRPERPLPDKGHAELRQPSGDMAETATDVPEPKAPFALTASRLIA